MTTEQLAEANRLFRAADALYHEGALRESVEMFEKSLSIARDAGDPVAEAANLNSLGLACADLGRKRDALEHYGEALTLAQAVGERAGEATIRNNLGLLHSELGHPGEALQHLQEALRIAGEEDSEITKGQALNNLGLVYSRLGRPGEALEHHKRALVIAAEIEDLRGAMAAWCNLGQLCSELGRPGEAEGCYEEALEVGRLAGDRADFDVIGATLNSLGVLCKAAGRPKEAADYFKEARQIAVEHGIRSGEGTTLNNLALLGAELGRPDAALTLLKQSLVIAREVGDRSSEITALSNLAAQFEHAGEVEAAVSHYERAIEAVEGLRGEIPIEESRTSYFATVGDIYNAFTSLLVGCGEGSRALHMAERSRARTFLELLAEAQADIREGVDPEARKEAQRLLGELSALRTRLAQAPSSKLEREQQELELAYQRHEARLRSENPRYAALTQLTAWELPEIRASLLDHRTALLEYVLSERGSLLFCVLKDDFEVLGLPPRAEIEQQVRELRAAVLHGLPSYPHGHELYRALIAPAAHLIEGKDLLVCADGALHYLPFSLLLTEEPGEGPDEPGETIDPGSRRSAVSGSEPLLLRRVEALAAGRPAFDYAALPYLVHRHAISYAPSATVAGLVRVDAEAAERSYDGDLAAVADPQQPTGGDVELEAALAHTRDRLEPLPFTAEEVRGLAELFDDDRVTLRTDIEATKDEVAALTSGERRFRFFHIASHGLLDPEKPQFSGLVLSPGSVRDPFWRTFEIFNARIPSELVVLSACETGLGKVVSGEGIVGLTRAFLYAGAAAVCVSLWKVADESSPPLMRAFYAGILAGDRKARALRAAQLTMLDEGLYAHPYWWAPFVVVGSR